MRKGTTMYLITHNGKFHADDVCATGLLKIWAKENGFDRVIVIRTRNVEGAMNYSIPDAVVQAHENDPDNMQIVVYDVGLGKYDHHQIDSEIRENGVPYAAFGLLWRDLGPQLVSQENVEEFDLTFVQPIDAADNGYVDRSTEPVTQVRKRTELASIISNLNPVWDSLDDPQVAFDHAVDLAEQILDSQLKSLVAIERAREIVNTCCVNTFDGGVIELPQEMPYKNIIPKYKMFDDVLLVVYPKNGVWTLNTVPDSEEGAFGNRMKLPVTWMDHAPEGLKFVHKALFMATFDTREHAIAAAHEAIRYFSAEE